MKTNEMKINCKETCVGKPGPYESSGMFMALWSMQRADVNLETGTLKTRGQVSGSSPSPLIGDNVRFARTPWGTEVPVWDGQGGASRPLPPLTRPEFTVETWLFMPFEKNRKFIDQTIFEYRVDGRFRWSLTIDRDFYLRFDWEDEDGHRDVCRSAKPVMEILYGGEWHHVAATFKNARALFTSDQDFIKHKHPSKAAVMLYCTAAGAPWPRRVGAKTGFTRPMLHLEGGDLTVSAAADGKAPFMGALAEASVSEPARTENRFFTLGLPRPEGLEISSDFDCGSGRDPVLNPEGEIVVSGTLISQPSSSWNLYFRVDGEPGPRKFCLPVSGSVYIRYDDTGWEKILNARLDTGGEMGQRLHCSIDIARTPAYISSFIPYLMPDILALEKELAGWDCFTAFDIARTARNRPVRGWLVTDPSTEIEGKKLVVLTSGQHAPQEMHSGHTFNAMLRELRRRADLRRRLKDVAFLIVPVVNIDSAYEGGNTALNRNARNLNRVWDTLEEPEIAGIAGCIENLAERGARVMLGLDFHSGGTCINHPRGIRHEDMEALSPGLSEKQARALDSLEKHLGFRREFRRFCAVEGAGGGKSPPVTPTSISLLSTKRRPSVWKWAIFIISTRLVKPTSR